MNIFFIEVHRPLWLHQYWGYRRNVSEAKNFDWIYFFFTFFHIEEVFPHLTQFAEKLLNFFCSSARSLEKEMTLISWKSFNSKALISQQVTIITSLKSICSLTSQSLVTFKINPNCFQNALKKLQLQKFSHYYVLGEFLLQKNAIKTRFNCSKSKA